MDEKIKIALIHDHFLFFGGAERVILAFLKIYPTADIYLAFASEENIKILQKYTRGKIFVSPFRHLLPSAYLADYFKPFLYYWWKSLNLAKYDLVFSSSHSFSSKSVNPPRHIPHISYIHTPPRYLWCQFNETNWINKKPYKYLLSPFLNHLRKLDYKDAQLPDILIANSKNVQSRIKKYYRRDSILIYPPVRIPKKLTSQKQNYYLCVSRLVKQKGIDLTIKACNKLKKPLIVVGTGKEEFFLKSIAGPTIKFLGKVSDKKLAQIYNKAKALIYPSFEEDFGLAPLEAMAHGTPVIGCHDGGLVESVLNGKTGILIKKHSVNSLVFAIKKLEGLKIKSSDCIKRAKKFSEKMFRKKIKSIISKSLKEKMKIKKIKILGVKINITNYKQLLYLISENIKKKKKTYIFPAAVGAIMSYRENRKFLQTVNKKAMVVTDGMPLVWLCKYYGQNQATRVYGPNLMKLLLSEGVIKKYRFFLFGGKKGQAKKLKDKICQTYKGIDIVGYSDAEDRPPKESLTRKVITEVNRNKADIVFVGLGSPHQEKWILKYGAELNSPILIGVGAAFDFLSGEKKQAPIWMQEKGLEWLFRLLQEPQRLWYRYTITNLKFLIAVAKEIFKRK